MRSVVKYKMVLMVVAVMSFCQTQAQCAMCRAVLESQEGQTAAEGINDGIVYLMAVPYLLVGGLGYLIYKKFNTSKKKV